MDMHIYVMICLTLMPYLSYTQLLEHKHNINKLSPSFNQSNETKQQTKQQLNIS